jgi:hypothetical protein
MLGHGQIEGFGEKYGMEYRRATLDEQPDRWLVERHEREIFPLLHRRDWFAEAHDFLMFDFHTDGGAIDENVLAYSNGHGPTRSLVVFHDHFGSTAGTIRESTAYARKSASGAKRLVRRSLAEGLGLPDDPSMFVTFRDARTGLAYLRSCRDVRERGLWMALDAYQGHVFWEFRELADGVAGQWRRLAERLGGRGVASLDEALRELLLEPVHEPLRALFDDGHIAAVLDGTATDADLDVLEERLAAVLAAVAMATRVSGDPVLTAARIRDEASATYRDGAGGLSRGDRAALLGWLVLSRLGELAPGADVGLTSLAWYDELRLAPVVASGFRSVGIDEGGAWGAADLVRVLLALPRPSTIRGRGRQADLRLLEGWLTRDPIRAAMGLNTWEGVEWLDREHFANLLRWAVRLDAIETGRDPDTKVVDRLAKAAEKAGYRVDALLELLSQPAPRRGGGAAVTSAERRER